MHRIPPALALATLAPFTLAAQDASQQAVVDWVRETAVVLETPLAGNGFGDLEPLLRSIGDARIVSLGEATHGSREFFQLKHRMLELLVERSGFTVFAIEASYPDCIAINDYVEHGIGDPAEALHGQGFWTWDTEEVLALIEWMHDYNEDPKHERKLRFYGIDMQRSQPAVAGALAYVARHDEELAGFLAEDLEPLRSPTIFSDAAGLPEGRKQSLELGLDGLLEFLDLEREALLEAGSAAEWARARQHAVVARQAWNLMAGQVGPHGNSWRDRCMADNVAWVLEQEPAGTRMVLWAHNGHVKRDGPPHGYPMMGHYLEQAFGDEHVVFGFGFHHGGFQAILSPRPEGDAGPALRPFDVGPPAAGSIDELLASAELPLFALDLRAPPEGPVADWLGTSRLMRSIGALYSHSSAERWYRPTILAEQFDLLLYVMETTPARPNPLTRRAHGIGEER